mmetsp:Transcript_18111/g.37153  ORF Transcript_18111/g.37153 Transcript_18111/m.37153 type:complete len:368 (+) Transcript_18111:332-1435(+)
MVSQIESGQGRCFEAGIDLRTKIPPIVQTLVVVGHKVLDLLNRCRVHERPLRLGSIRRSADFLHILGCYHLWIDGQPRPPALGLQIYQRLIEESLCIFLKVGPNELEESLLQRRSRNGIQVVVFLGTEGSRHGISHGGISYFVHGKGWRRHQGPALATTTDHRKAGFRIGACREPQRASRRRFCCKGIEGQPVSQRCFQGDHARKERHAEFGGKPRGKASWNPRTGSMPTFRRRAYVGEHHGVESTVNHDAGSRPRGASTTRNVLVFVSGCYFRLRRFKFRGRFRFLGVVKGRGTDDSGYVPDMCSLYLVVAISCVSHFPSNYTAHACPPMYNGPGGIQDPSWEKMHTPDTDVDIVEIPISLTIVVC